MAHTPETRKRALEKMKAKRLSWLQENGPCRLCGSSDRLQVDHIDRNTKVTHRIWTWSEKRRLEELSKCQVLCYPCHRIKSNKENSESDYSTRSGENNCLAKLTWIEVSEIRLLYVTGNYSHRQLGKIYGINHSNITNILNHRTYACDGKLPKSAFCKNVA